METLLKFMGDLFIASPYFALIPALFFGILYAKSKIKLQWITSLLWFVYALYEGAIFLHILCNSECNIRVDLLLIYPLLLIISTWALFRFFLPVKKQ